MISFCRPVGWEFNSLCSLQKRKWFWLDNWETGFRRSPQKLQSRPFFRPSMRGIGYSFQLAITTLRIDLISYGTATAQSWRNKSDLKDMTLKIQISMCLLFAQRALVVRYISTIPSNFTWIIKFPYFHLLWFHPGSFLDGLRTSCNVLSLQF